MPNMTASLCCILRREIDALRAALEAERQSLSARESYVAVARRAIAVPEDLTDGLRQMDDVQEVVVVGGSTCSPKVQQMVPDLFGGKEMNNDINTGEAVAYGAAVQGFILTGGKSEHTEGLLPLSKAPHTLGIETADAVMKPIIKRNSLSFERTDSHIISKISDNQTDMCIRVFEDKSDMTNDCHFLGEFELSGIPPGTCGKTEIDITFELEANGVLNIKAKEKSTDNYLQISATNENGCIRKAEIERKILDSSTYKDQKEQQRKRIEAIDELENYMNLLKKYLDGSVVSTDMDNSLKYIINEAMDNACCLVNDKNATVKEYNQQKEHIQWLYQLILKAIDQRRVDAKNMLENYITFLKDKISDPIVTEQLNERDKGAIIQAVEDAEDWIKNNPDARKEVYERFKEEIECICAPIITLLQLNSDNSEYSDFVMVE